MSIANRIEEITKHLKNDYTNIEALVGEVSVDKNIENIAPILDDLWEAQPHTTGTGTDLSLNTKKGKSKVDYSGNTSQGENPSPDYPQEIHSVSGDNVIRSCGKNIWDESIFNSLKNDEDSESYIFNNNKLLNVNLTPNITFKENTQYTIQYIAKQISGNPRLRIVYTDNTNQDIETSTIATTLTKYTQTSTANKTINYITAVYSSNTTNGFYIKKNSVCIKEGTDTTYEPYTKTDYEIDLPVENLFDGELESGSVDIDTGTNIVNANNIRTKNYISIKPNTEYTLSSSASKERWGVYYDENKTYLNKVHINTNATYNVTITTIANAHYIRWYEVNNNDLTTKWQIEKGTKANHYTPYGTTPIKLNKISTYKDGFIRNSGKNLAIYNEISDLTRYANACYSTDTGEKKKVLDTIKALPKDIELIGSWNFVGTGTPVNTDISGKRITIYYTDNSSQVTAKGTSFTIPSSKTIDYVILYGNADNTTNTWSNIQFEKGDTATSYEPYGNGEWYLKSVFDNYTITGNESWNVFGTGTSNYFYYAYMTQKEGTTPLLCSHFKQVTITTTNTDEGITIAGTNLMRVRQGQEQSPTDFANMLKQKTPKMLILRVTPTYTKITGTLEEQLEMAWRANTYSTTTNISQINNDLPFELFVTALSDGE